MTNCFCLQLVIGVQHLLNRVVQHKNKFMPLWPIYNKKFNSGNYNSFIRYEKTKNKKQIINFVFFNMKKLSYNCQDIIQKLEICYKKLARIVLNQEILIILCDLKIAQGEKQNHFKLVSDYRTLKKWTRPAIPQIASDKLNQINNCFIYESLVSEISLKAFCFLSLCDL